MSAGFSRSRDTTSTGFVLSHPFAMARPRTLPSNALALFTRTPDIFSALVPGNAFMRTTNFSTSSMVKEPSANGRSSPKKGIRCVSRRLFRSA